MSMNRRAFKQYVRRRVESAGNLYTPGIAKKVIKYADNAIDLIGQRVSIHTNRNQHIWSIKTTDAKHTLLAYAFDKVLLADVCWVQPQVSAARSTYHASLGGQRNVQAFAEGVLIGFDDLFSEQDLDLNLPAIQLIYRPKPLAEYVGAFRSVEDPSIGVASSEFGILEYLKPLGDHDKTPGRRPVTSIAFGDIQTIPEDHLSQYMNAIVDTEDYKGNLKPHISGNCKTYRKKI
jgi:hypothetical protein